MPPPPLAQSASSLVDTPELVLEALTPRVVGDDRRLTAAQLLDWLAARSPPWHATRLSRTARSKLVVRALKTLLGERHVETELGPPVTWALPQDTQPPVTAPVAAGASETKGA